MAEVYASLIMKGVKKFSDVPEKLKDAVAKILEEHGWVGPVTEE